MSTTITISEALKAALVDIRDDNEELSSLDSTICHVIDHRRPHAARLTGYEETLTEPVKVAEATKSRLKSLKESGDYADYEAVLRDRIGASQRDTGEEPVDVRPL